MALEISGKAPATYEHAVLQLQRPLWERRSAGAVKASGIQCATDTVLHCGASLRMSSRRRWRQPVSMFPACWHY
jgi:hypothetical protein